MIIITRDSNLTNSKYGPTKDQLFLITLSSNEDLASNIYDKNPSMYDEMTSMLQSNKQTKSEIEGGKRPEKYATDVVSYIIVYRMYQPIL